MTRRKSAPPADDYEPTPPFVLLPNPHADRGHRGSPCKGCKGAKPIGGWAAAYPRGDDREFKGG